MQVGHPFVGVHHGQLRVLGVAFLDLGLQLRSNLLVHAFHAPLEVPKPVTRVHPELAEELLVLLEQIFEINSHTVPKNGGITHFHQGRLEVQRKKHILLLGVLDLLLEKRFQLRHTHECGVKNLSCFHSHPFLQHSDTPILRHMLEFQVVRSTNNYRLLVLQKVPLLHCSDVGLAIGTPGAHLVGELLGILLHGCGGPPVCVALPQNSVHSTAEDLAVASFDVLLLRRGRLIRIVRDLEPLGLQLTDAFQQLGHGRAIVRQLHDVSLR
mmetsp:Transcript_8301/g.20473  ORF Transcript_8301/g.20473 Transcript_8301/m.20473 type:complete len:268 (+) Transcript_8301:753-1556(+)